MNVLLWTYHIRDLGVDGMAKLAVPEDQRSAHLNQLKIELGAREIWHLATCNRIEYLMIFNVGTPIPKCPLAEAPKAQTHLPQIVTHLLTVSSGADSLIFGENQILGQIKSALQFAETEKLMGPKLRKLFNLVQRESKSIRTQTGLNSLNTSVAAVAGKTISTHVRSDGPLLLVGSGETQTLLIQHLKKRGFKNLIVTSRTDSRSKKLAQDFGAQVLRWDDFRNGKCAEASAIVLATTSKKEILDEIHFHKKLKLVVDLSVPRNCDPKLAARHKVFYVDIPGLKDKSSLDKNQMRHMKQVVVKQIQARARVILHEISNLDIGRTISQTLDRTRSIHQDFIQSSLPKEIRDLSPEQQKALREWSEALLKKINHIHIENLRNYVQTPRRDS